MAAVLSQLTSVKRGWVSSFKPRDTVIITIITGQYKVTINVSLSEGRSRLWLSKVYFANNQDRQRMLEKGTLLDFDGLSFFTGNEFRVGPEASNSWYKSGIYADDLLKAINSPWNVAGQEVEDSEYEDDVLTIEEQEAIEVLRCFVDSEYELERIAAQQSMPFEALSIGARSQRTTYRLHYEIRFDEHDYNRLLDAKPTLLEMLNEMREPTDILMEVTDLNPIENQPVVYVSVEKQASAGQVPDQAFFNIAALPTLKKVRNDVIDLLEAEKTKNTWLLPLAAGVYQHNLLAAVNVPLLPSKFPPTPSQVKAINSGAGSEDYTLVLGPPGTGKTTVILQWVKYFAAQGKRVLVTSQNNKAVDNVLERLAEEDDFECLRIGNENKISSSLESIMLDNKAAELQERMFSAADETLAHLEKQLGYLKILLTHRQDIETAIDRLVQAETDQEVIISSLESLKAMVITCEGNILAKDNEVHHVNRIIQNINDSGWLFFKPIMRLLNRRKVKRFQNKIHQLKDSIGQKHLERNKLFAQIRDYRIELKAIQQKIIQSRHRIDGYIQPIEPLIEEIQLPGQNGERLTKLDLLNLDQSFRKLDSIHANLTKWFYKLKNERQQALYKILIENVNVVGATCIGINTKSLFRELDFDVVIVDESGQIQLHNLIVPLSRANKAILVGDHKQLPPVVGDEMMEEIDAKGFSDYRDLYRLSWFEHLWNAAPEDRKIMLDTQFRCPSIISDFVSEAFYEGNYFAGTGMEKKQPLLSFCPQPMVWIDTTWLDGKNEKARLEGGRSVVQDNPCETKLVIELLKTAIHEVPELADKREIGILVPYASHVKAIQTAIRRAQKRGELLELTMPLNELVASVDSFQGQERDLIIFTFTRSNPQGKVGFLSDWRRLNVAQTRAKKQLIMIGDSQTLTKGANRAQANDVAFKQAMQLLKGQCQQKGAILQAARFLPGAKTVARPKIQSHPNSVSMKPEAEGYHG
ncbi:DEAD/DEAH box helicase [Maribrevibacterium harenarium]|uniref:DEAD/DEAH box helicase n=1 Tax=Maribrevibacterium harenarium TaxID=2589817 RepID=UPI0015E30E4E|nr:AAA domain-containing protein [Maribrevibacterium harenarium]